VISCTLGWDDDTSLTLEVEGETYDCYVECDVALECPNAFTSKTSFPLPINPWSHICQGWPPPLYTNIGNLVVGATKVEEGWVGRKNCVNRTCSTQQRLKIHVGQVKSITCPNIYLWTPSKIHHGWVGVPNHAWTTIPKCVKTRKTQKIHNVIHQACGWPWNEPICTMKHFWQS
jgi:hypothetical protein